jgi:hypothetical protein
MNHADDAARAVQETLGSHRWRGLTAEGLARLFLAARDRQRVQLLLEQCSVGSGTWHPVHPVDADDVRVAPIVEHLRGLRWSRMALPSVVDQLEGALDQWWFRWQWRRGSERPEPSGDEV